MHPQTTVHKYLEYNSVCTLVRFGTPHSLSCKRVFPPPRNQRGGGHPPGCEVVSIRTTEEKVYYSALSALWLRPSWFVCHRGTYVSRSNLWEISAACLFDGLFWWGACLSNQSPVKEPVLQYVLSPWEFVQCTVSPQLVSNVMALCPIQKEKNVDMWYSSNLSRYSRSHRITALYLIAVGGGGEGGDPFRWMSGELVWINQVQLTPSSLSHNFSTDKRPVYTSFLAFLEKIAPYPIFIDLAVHKPLQPDPVPVPDPGIFSNKSLTNCELKKWYRYMLVSRPSLRTSRLQRPPASFYEIS